MSRTAARAGHAAASATHAAHAARTRIRAAEGAFADMLQCRRAPFAATSGDGEAASAVATLPHGFREPVSMTTALPSRDDIDQAIRSLGLATTASELQGALLGWLAGGGSADGNWLAGMMA